MQIKKYADNLKCRHLVKFIGAKIFQFPEVNSFYPVKNYHVYGRETDMLGRAIFNFTATEIEKKYKNFWSFECAKIQ